MWIFCNDSMLSIVAPPGGQGRTHLLVRGRVAGDIRRVFPGATEQMTPGRDYRYRALIERQVVANAIAQRVASIDYPNFKGACREDDRHDAYLSCWTAMNRLQQDRQRTTAQRQELDEWRRRGARYDDGLLLDAPRPAKRKGKGKQPVLKLGSYQR